MVPTVWFYACEALGGIRVHAHNRLCPSTDKMLLDKMIRSLLLVTEITMLIKPNTIGIRKIFHENVCVVTRR